MSIRNRLILYVVIALLLSLSISIGLNAYYSKEYLKIDVQKNHIPVILKDISAQIDKYLNTPILISRQMALDNYLVDFAIEDDPQDKIQHVAKYLRKSKEYTKADATFFVTTKNKNYYYENGFLKKMDSQKDKHDIWYDNFLNTKKEYELNVDFDDVSKKTMVFINCLVKNDQNQTIGVTGLGVYLTELINTINQYKIGDNGFVYLVNKDGLIQIHNDQSKILKQNIKDINGLKEISQQLLSAKLNVYTDIIKINNEETFVASRSIPSLDWYIIAQIPASQVYQPINQIGLNLVGINLIVVAMLVIVIFYISKNITYPIESMYKTISQISGEKWDLTKRINVYRNDEIGKIAIVFNQMMDKFQLIINQLRQSKKQVAEASYNLADMTDQIVQSSEEQEKASETMGASMNQLTDGLNQIKEATIVVREMAEHATSVANESKTLIKNTTQDITKISDTISNSAETISALQGKSEQIRHVLSVIQDITNQTNLLALNASIEAARTGEAGRGFAVVADEIRKLSQKTSVSTIEIQKIIQGIQVEIDRTSDMMSSSVSHVVDGADTIKKMVVPLESLHQSADDALTELKALSQTTEYQAQSSRVIENNIDMITKMIDQNTTSIQTMAHSTKSLKTLINSIEESLNQFKS